MRIDSKRNRDCRKAVKIRYILSCLVIALLPSVGGVSVGVGSLMSRQALDNCESDLTASDADNDLRLTSDEYVDFVARQTNKRIDSSSFADLPSKFVLVYYWVACACAQFEEADSTCCAGKAAHIEIDDSGTVQPDVYSLRFCSRVAEAIDEVLPATPSPTAAPTFGTTSPTSSPSVAPSQSPTIGSSQSPTTSATSQSPTISATSQSPTATVASQSPTTILASQSPTNVASQSPTLVASSSPTISATTFAPSMSPSFSAPTVAPSTVTPTMSPTFENQLSVSFLYGLTNQNGLSADDIFNMVDNTLRTGLEIATRTITIDILNTTFPQRSLVGNSAGKTGLSAANAVPSLSGHRGRHNGGIRRHLLSASVWEAVKYATIDLYGPVVGLAMLDALNDPEQDQGLIENTPERSLVRFGSVRGSNNRRELVFFTDEAPVEITKIVDNPNCPTEDDATRCSIVSSIVTVILEGEDSGVVRRALLEGLRESVNDGSFQDAIPPEHQG